MNKADTAYWILLQHLPPHVQDKLAFGVEGILMFGAKSMPMKFSNCYVTKLGLKGFLLRSTKCGICLGFALVGSNGCAQCGFLICTVCQMKLALAQCHNLYLPVVTIACAKCRKKTSYSIPPSLDNIIYDMEKFNEEEKLTLRSIIEIFKDVISRKNGSVKQIQKMRRINDELKAKLDISKCADCKNTFVNKRAKCGNCKKVAYCDAQCQKHHWKQHKKDCNLFKTFNDDQ